MDERTKKAFDFAQESTKQIIALSTGIITLTITFSKDFVGCVPSQTRVLALCSWGFLLLSVFFGLWTLLELTGTLEPTTVQYPPRKPSIRGTNVTLPSMLQVITFLLGLIFTVVFGFFSIY